MSWKPIRGGMLILIVPVVLGVLLVLLVPSFRIRALGLLRGEPFAEDFMPLSYHIQRLHDPDVSVRTEALNRISQLKQKAEPAVPELVALIHDPVRGKELHDRVELRHSAITTLGMIASPGSKAVPALAQLLTDPDTEVRVSAVTALRRIGPNAAPAVPALLAALRDPVRAVRSEAARALRGADRTSLKKTLQEQLTDSNAEIRESAALSAGELGPDAGNLVPALKKALQDPDKKVQEAAADSLKRIQPGSSRTTDPLAP